MLEIGKGDVERKMSTPNNFNHFTGKKSSKHKRKKKIKVKRQHVNKYQR